MGARLKETRAPRPTKTAMPPYWPRAKRALRRADPVLGEVIGAFRGEALEPRGDPFVTLARAIVGQQISVKAAAAVWGRLEARVGPMSPERVAGSTLQKLRACGLSRGKAGYCKCLAEGFLEGALDPAGWRAQDDEAVIAELTKVKGVGRWTAEMFLIFHLLRPDVLPLGDIGLQRALARHYGDGEALEPDEMSALAEPWRPWRSVATWYLWRSLDPIPITY
jgi:DNA-3-methyladenine glycosylase II